MNKLTIITINYNNASGLSRTIDSVMNQTSRDFEYIIVDGASSDNSCQVIRDKSLVVNGEFELDGIMTTCISDSDTGIYNAMNKGIRMAKGEYIHFLNSGDWLVDKHVVEKMLYELNELSDNGYQPDIFVGNKIMVRPDGKVRYGHNDKRTVTALTFYRGTLEHTSAYIRRAMFEVVGLYDESLRIVSDWKWYFDAVLNYNALVAFTDIYVSYFDNTGISSTNQTLDKAERRQVLVQMLPTAVLADYDHYHFAIDQHERLRCFPFLFKLVYLTERTIFKFDKWNAKYWSWKSKTII